MMTAYQHQAYAVTIAEGDAHRAAIEFEENDKMIEYYNDNVTSKKAFFDKKISVYLYVSNFMTQNQKRVLKMVK